jgi:hypothetical protein
MVGNEPRIPRAAFPARERSSRGARRDDARGLCRAAAPALRARNRFLHLGKLASVYKFPDRRGLAELASRATRSGTESFQASSSLHMSRSRLLQAGGYFGDCLPLRKTGLTRRNSENICLPQMKVGPLNSNSSCRLAQADEPPASSNLNSENLRPLPSYLKRIQCTGTASMVRFRGRSELSTNGRHDRYRSPVLVIPSMTEV